MIVTDQAPVIYADPLPATVDAVVIGAGVIGVFTAWFLQQSGASVLVCDKGRVAGEQSSRNWGWIRQQGRDEAELPIMQESINLWEQVAADLTEDIGFHRGGIAYLAPDTARMRDLEQWLPIAARHGLDSQALDRNAVGDLIRDGDQQWAGGIFTPSDARAEPFVAVPAVARALHARGVVFREDCAVRSVETTRGKVSAVITEHGRVGTGRVICCAGAWSALLLRHLKYELPQLTVRATVARTAACESVFDGNASGPDFAFRRRADGGYTLALSDHMEHFAGWQSVRQMRRFWPALRMSWQQTRVRPGSAATLAHARGRWRANETTPFEGTRVLNPEPSAWAVETMAERLGKRLPALRDVPLAESWAGMIDATPDMVPVMSEIPDLPGMTVATGFSGHGFGIGPGAGKVVAGIALGLEPQYDLARFRYTRFFDGSPLNIGPIL